MSSSIFDFFMKYDYEYTPYREIMEQFWELCDEEGWTKDDPERAQALDGVRNAIADQFGHFYGSDGDSMASWTALFQVLKVAQVPQTPKQCKLAIQSIFVNICDLVDYSMDQSRSLRLFDNEVALAEYSRMSGKLFPQDDAYARGLLRYLLRHIFNPSLDRGTRGARGKRGGRGRRRARGTRGN